MAGWNMRTRLFACNALWSILLISSGCLASLNPVQPLPPDVLARCQGLSDSCREHVHVIVINGFDPSQITNAVGLAHFLKTSGFPNVYYTTQWTSLKYVKRIRDIKAADPNARIAVIGYSMGVCLARKLAQRSKEQGITIDLLVYLDAFAVNHRPEHTSADAARIVNLITVPRLGIFGSEPLAGAQNYQFLDVRHVKVPTESRIVERVIEELIALANAARA
jgi:pimeloyl-ACP methyl ester carboxylesterase